MWKTEECGSWLKSVETFGSLVLDEALPCGQWRELTEAEASALYRDAQMEEKHG